MIINPGEINLEDSLKICQETLKKARAEGFMPLTVTVIDVAGVIRSTLSEDGSGLIRSKISYAKAWTCLAFGVSTNKLRDIFEDQPRLDKAIAGMPFIAASIVAPTVPEYIVFCPALFPRFTPESTKLNLCSYSEIPTITQSAGVP